VCCAQHKCISVWPPLEIQQPQGGLLCDLCKCLQDDSGYLHIYHGGSCTCWGAGTRAGSPPACLSIPTQACAACTHACTQLPTSTAAELASHQHQLSSSPVSPPPSPASPPPSPVNPPPSPVNSPAQPAQSTHHPAQSTHQPSSTSSPVNPPAQQHQQSSQPTSSASPSPHLRALDHHGVRGQVDSPGQRGRAHQHLEQTLAEEALSERAVSAQHARVVDTQTMWEQLLHLAVAGAHHLQQQRRGGAQEGVVKEAWPGKPETLKP
jgi:hypothetical protein